MIDPVAARAAFHARAASLVVATTGVMSLSATTAGFHRASGSFVADGFVRGMEIVPSGFADNTPRMITAVTASDLTVIGALTAQAETGGRSITAGFPTLRDWEHPTGLEPLQNRHYVEMDYVPAPPDVWSMPGDHGAMRETGLGVFRWYAPEAAGDDALELGATALAEHFAVGWEVVLADGNTLETLNNPAPGRGQINPTGDGWKVVTITIAWIAETENAVI